VVLPNHPVERTAHSAGSVLMHSAVPVGRRSPGALRQPHIPGTYLNFPPGTRLEILDPYTVRFVFPEPDGGALVKLAIMHIANRQFYCEHGWGEKHW
jgi:hypothetical protein